MMTLLHLLSYVGGLAAFLFITLSLASGLLWLAELIEEHSKYAKVIGMRAIYAVVTLHVLLILTDGLPVLPTLFSIACHLVYLSNFSSTWPFISLTSLRFILSCILVVADHFTWFFHFAAKAQEAKRYRGSKYRYGTGQVKDDAPAFMDVAAFFAICVWFVPLFLFLSLSANDNALPSFGNDPSRPNTPSAIDLSTPGLGDNPSHRQIRSRTSTSLVKSLFTPIESLLPRMRARKRNEEGLIAPRTPVRGSPLHSPVNLPNASYFPWGDEGSQAKHDGGSNSSQSSYSNLTPDSAANRAIHQMKNPPPPRRVQSEHLASRTVINPRGLATRDGVPVVTDSQLSAEPEGLSDGLSTARQRPGSPSPLKMSLGPKGMDHLGGAEIVDNQLRPRRKAD